jgi:hypothetical protein
MRTLQPGVLCRSDIMINFSELRVVCMGSTGRGRSVSLDWQTMATACQGVVCMTVTSSSNNNGIEITGSSPQVACLSFGFHVIPGVIRWSTECLLYFPPNDVKMSISLCLFVAFSMDV